MINIRPIMRQASTHSVVSRHVWYRFSWGAHLVIEQYEVTLARESNELRGSKPSCAGLNCVAKSVYLGYERLTAAVYEAWKPRHQRYYLQALAQPLLAGAAS